jgi:hypothetical protein
MKNITLSIDEALYHKARVKAAERKTSLSRMVADYLRQVVADSDERTDARTRMAILFEKSTAGEYGRKLSRDEMHDE